MIGGAMSMFRAKYCGRVWQKIDEFGDKQDSELKEVCLKQNPWKNIFRTVFVPYSDGDADYEAAKAVRNMRTLGIDSFDLEKKTIFGLYDKLGELERDARKYNAGLGRKNDGCK